MTDTRTDGRGASPAASASDSRPPADRVLAHPAGQRGLLRTASGHELTVQTYERGEDVVLVVLTDLGDPLPPEALDPATLEYATVRGIIRLQGEAHLEARSLVSFHPETEPEVIQRRAFVRVHTPQQVLLGPTLAGAAQRAHTIDVSGGGMLLSGAPELELHEPISFELRLGADPTPVEGTARVVRVDPDRRRAVAFDRIEETDRQRLIRFVFDCLRTARAKTRGDLI